MTSITCNNDCKYTTYICCDDIVTKISDVYFEITSVYLYESYNDFTELVKKSYKSTCIISSCTE